MCTVPRVCPLRVSCACTHGAKRDACRAMPARCTSARKGKERKGKERRVRLQGARSARARSGASAHDGRCRRVVHTLVAVADTFVVVHARFIAVPHAWRPLMIIRPMSAAQSLPPRSVPACAGARAIVVSLRLDVHPSFVQRNMNSQVPFRSPARCSCQPARPPASPRSRPCARPIGRPRARPRARRPARPLAHPPTLRPPPRQIPRASASPLARPPARPFARAPARLAAPPSVARPPSRPRGRRPPPARPPPLPSAPPGPARPRPVAPAPARSRPPARSPGRSPARSPARLCVRPPARPPLPPRHVPGRARLVNPGRSSSGGSVSDQSLCSHALAGPVASGKSHNRREHLSCIMRRFVRVEQHADGRKHPRRLARGRWCSHATAQAQSHQEKSHYRRQHRSCIMPRFVRAAIMQVTDSIKNALPAPTSTTQITVWPRCLVTAASSRTAVAPRGSCTRTRYTIPRPSPARAGWLLAERNDEATRIPRSTGPCERRR